MKYLGPLGVPPLEITPSRIRIVTTWRVFSCAEAAKLIGYSPLVPLQVGFKVYVSMPMSVHFFCVFKVLNCRPDSLKAVPTHKYAASAVRNAFAGVVDE